MEMEAKKKQEEQASKTKRLSGSFNSSFSKGTKIESDEGRRGSGRRGDADRWRRENKRKRKSSDRTNAER
jgi:hypothetical protein